MMRFIVIDLETTSQEPEQAQVVEWAAIEMAQPWFGEHADHKEHGGLVRPLISIPPETSAVHHIIDADVAESPNWELESTRLIAIADDPEVIGVAHNATYERTVLAPLNLRCRWLCTYKAALRVWPEAPRHGNEALRYWLGYGTGRRYEQQPHSAMHDARVTALILGELLQKAELEDMLRWTDEPAMLPRCPIGQYRDWLWAQVPIDFLEWILYRARDMREDIRFCANAEVDRRVKEYGREREAAAAATAPAGTAVVEEADDSDIPF